MNMDPVKIFVLFFILVFGARASDERWDGIKSRLLFTKSFVNVRINSHNEKELRIGYNRVFSMETSLEDSFVKVPEYNVVMRQVTDGRRLVQAIYQGGILKECDFTKDTNQIIDFISSFVSSNVLSIDNSFGDAFEAYHWKNVTLKNITLAHEFFEGMSFLKEFSSFVNLRSLRMQCREFYKHAKSLALMEAREHVLSTDDNSNTDESNLGVFNKIISSFQVSDSTPYKSTSEHKLTKRSTEPVKRARSKRSAFDLNSVLIFPGTKWCGKGDLAQCYEDLGEDQELDVCCRDHDCCPYIIPPFSTRFNMFNYRFHSLLHCDCDQRFRGCLRQSISTTANIIGKIYFNILGSKCFVFEDKDVCMERSWWGRCRRYEKQETAVIKPQVSFFEKCNESTENTSISNVVT